MKKEEMQKKSAEKVQAINTLCKQLEVEISAKQVISKEGFIETIVFYLDTEKYEEDKPEEIKDEKKDEKTTNLRGQNPKA
jgi:hypothetical protein